MLCKWCGPRDHEDAKCPKPKPGVNLLSIETETCDEETLVITRKQAKTYLNTEEEKKRLQQARAELEKEMEVEKSHTKDTVGTSMRNHAEQNIIKQIMQTEVPMKLKDLILTMPQL